MSIQPRLTRLASAKTEPSSLIGGHLRRPIFLRLQTVKRFTERCMPPSSSLPPDHDHEPVLGLNTRYWYSKSHCLFIPLRNSPRCLTPEAPSLFLLSKTWLVVVSCFLSPVFRILVIYFRTLLPTTRKCLVWANQRHGHSYSTVCPPHLEVSTA